MEIGSWMEKRIQRIHGRRFKSIRKFTKESDDSVSLRVSVSGVEGRGLVLRLKALINATG